MRLRWFIAAIAVCVFVIDRFGLVAPLLNEISTAYSNINSDFAGFPGSVLAALITAGVAWIALRTNAAVNIRNKRMDVILHCNNRYDDLYKLRHEIDKESKPELIKAYFRRYWGLQSDQIDYWLAGYVDPETMASWVISLTASLKDKAIGDDPYRTPYEESWNSEAIEVHRVVNELLAETVAFSREYLQWLVDPAARYAATLQYLRIIEADERSLIRHLSRDSHRRMSVDDLAATIRSAYWQKYNQLDTRRRPFHWLYRMLTAIQRGFAAIPGWLKANRRHRLEAKLMPTVAGEKLKAEGFVTTPEVAVSP